MDGGGDTREEYGLDIPGVIFSDPVAVVSDVDDVADLCSAGVRALPAQATKLGTSHSVANADGSAGLVEKGGLVNGANFDVGIVYSNDRDVFVEASAASSPQNALALIPKSLFSAAGFKCSSTLTAVSGAMWETS